MTFAVRFEPGLKPVFKHGSGDQKPHGSWANGSSGTATELSDDEIRDIIYSSKTVEQMLHRVAELQGKSMKPKVADLSDEEINLYRGIATPERDIPQLLDGKIPFTPWQTWGQGIYATPDRSDAESYGQVVGIKLDKKANILRGEQAAFEVDYSGDELKSDFLDHSRVSQQVLSGGKDNFSMSDAYNVYWAGKGYDGYSPHGWEMVLFNNSYVTLNKKDITLTVQKHGTGDQKPHGSWADQGLSFAGLKAQKFIDGGGTLSETLSSKDSKVLEAKTMVEQMSAKLGFDFAIDYGVLQTMEAIRGIQIGIPLEPDNVIIAYDKNGAIAGAISFNRIDFKGRTPLLFINHLGSTGIIDGTGSSLTRRVIKLAASEKREMQLFALDSNATKFWEKMGFDDEMYSGMSMGMTLENVQSEASK